MNDLIKIDVEKPLIPDDWNYEESIKTGKQLFIRWKDITYDMASHFWIAREILRKPRRRTDLVPISEPDWGIYCQKISGIKNKKNAIKAFNRILNKFFPSCGRIHFSSESSEWTTPQLIIEKTIELLKEIDLDPCSNPDFPNVPAKNHFIKEDDALSKEWNGKIYMNPPYGSEIKKWINHLCEQYEKENIIEAIALVPSRTDTEWFRRMKTYLRCFIWGRLKFGESENSAPFPSMIVYLGNRLDEFKKIFSDIGNIYGLIK